MIHTAESFAALINGRQYLKELSKDEEAIAKDNNLVVCFGQGDDELIFCGAIQDQLGAYGGVEAYVINGNAIRDYQYDEDVAVLARYGYTSKPSIKVVSEWCPDEFEGSWLIGVEGIEGFHFDIMEDDDLYCRGVVFCLNPTL